MAQAVEDEIGKAVSPTDHKNRDHYKEKLHPNKEICAQVNHVSDILEWQLAYSITSWLEVGVKKNQRRICW